MPLHFRPFHPLSLYFPTTSLSLTAKLPTARVLTTIQESSIHLILATCNTDEGTLDGMGSYSVRSGKLFDMRY
jgi:hypothetical protein